MHYSISLNYSQATPASKSRDSKHDFFISRLETIQATMSAVVEQSSIIRQYELFWIQEGNGFLQVDLSAYELQQGNIYCICPGQLRYFLPNQKVEGYFISFSSEYCQQLDMVNYTPPVYGQPAGFLQPFIITAIHDAETELKGICTRLEKEFVDNSELSALLSQKLLVLFLLYLSRLAPQKIAFPETGRDRGLVRNFKQLLAEHFLQKKQVADYAALLCVSPGYLNQVVKRISGITASAHIQKYLVTEAKRQAMQYGKSMKEIAYGLGFDDSAHFSKFFKNVSGTNFTSFRQQLHLI